jgi:AraC family transcriptional regulator of adaptative response/methylated-DNA-[protein]-cysteine methyltransferase
MINPEFVKKLQTERETSALIQEENYWQAVLAKDTGMDGVFFFAVKTTGVFCKPSCPCRRPLRRNVVFYADLQDAVRDGFRPCLRCHPLKAAGFEPHSEVIGEVCRYIEQNPDGPVSLQALATHAGMSPFHLQRIFKAALGISPREYADACRVKLVRTELRSSDSVTRALYDAGYSSSSRLYENAGAHLGMTPATYRKGGAGASIRYTVTDSPLGRMLVAATEKGVCMISFGESDKRLHESLKHEFPAATIVRDESTLLPWIATLNEHLEGRQIDPNLPLDVRATAFQRRVWEFLRAIPYGTTMTYSGIARQLGNSKAMRAVARACATNPVSIAIPCHRVLREDGHLGGYRWGIERKEKLLRKEREQAPTEK